jgi:TatD DNase family protein
MLIDTHCHLDLEPIDEDIEGTLLRAGNEGVGAVITVAIDRESITKSVEIAAAFPSVYLSLGIHPNYTTKATDEDWVALEKSLNGPKVVAVGETGLDFYRDYSPREVQIEGFQRHIALAQRLDLPLVIHSRDADDAVLEVLASEGRSIKGVMHCFSGSYETVRRCLDLGLYISFAGPITYKNAADRREVAKHIPLDRILVETDSPFLSPEPFRGRPNEPARVRLVAQTLADVKGRSLEEMIEVTGKNVTDLFGIGL